VKAAIHCSWSLHVPTEFPGPVEIHVDCRKRSPKQPGVFDVLYLCEPEPILPAMTAYARGHLQLFDLVVVSTDDLVGVSPKVVPLEFGTSWIPDGAVLPAKRPGVSMVVGRKRRTEGHRLRHEVWLRQDEIRGPKSFFTSDRGWPRKLEWLRGCPWLDPLPANPWGWPALGDSKLPLFETQFHIAIENCRSRYYFTEKLIDCFLADTVPIYWGCKNIAEFFDASGIIQVETAAELIAACNSTSDAMYNAMAAARAANQERALRFVDLGTRLGSLIELSLASKAS
jgi:hypothetical protein